MFPLLLEDVPLPAYFDGLILDEFGDMKRSLMGEVILPCLSDRAGFLVLIGTAKGRNQFYEYKEMARADNKAVTLTAAYRPVLSLMADCR